MPCFTPLKAYRSEHQLTSNGKKAITFKESSDNHTSIQLPCGQCIGCRLERSRQWAVRCMHEAQLHRENCFITLTIDKKKTTIEQQTTLIKSDFQKFMKKLRRANPNVDIRYYYCGEYGENYGRPHYHACIFGYDFPDKEPLFSVLQAQPKNPLYTSEKLNKLWQHGNCVIGEVTFDSAAYVARYITKKITGPSADEYYSGRLPEFTNMSKKPAIGLRWIEKFKSDVYPSDEVVVKGKKVRPARYYDKHLEKFFPHEFDQIKMNREDLSHRYEISEEASPFRMNTKHESALLKTEKLIRSLESSDHKYDHHKNDYDRKSVAYNTAKAITKGDS